MSDFPVTIFYNPACGTSRNVLKALHEAGYEPEVVEYLQTGWTLAQLRDLLSRLAVEPRLILREKEPLVAELGLLTASDDDILDAMVVHPILVNRPIVQTPKGTRMCRPSELVFELLERSPECFTKEDGEQIVLRK